MTTPVTPAALAAAIDHTLLKPEATAAQVRRLCAEARTWGFASVCVNPWHVPLAARELAGGQVAACSVIGFPLGASRTPVKAAETRQAREDGAREFDMVLAVGALKEGRLDLVEADIRAVVEAAEGGLVKVIIETCLLSDEEKTAACQAAARAGAGFVKTSTGFGAAGATVEDVRRMRAAVGEALGVKASGGIRTLTQALAMLDAGASRLGTSAGVAIVEESKA